MYFTNFVKHDGYYESLCSLREGLGPILKCRAVRNYTKDYEVIIRDYETGKMVASKPGPMVHKAALYQTKIIAVNFIKSELKEHSNGQSNRP
ncbi:MAG: hypothetical protein E3J23_01965 [Candidatus Stahlbacteria bacterium]|nr:MAG: hypothetical protein E3J23_01965 [Candidatus Stahlbacteria bacterium]